MADGEEYRVTNIWIDEDGNPQITITHSTHNEKLDYEDVREKMEDGVVKRINSGNDAHEWRTN